MLLMDDRLETLTLWPYLKHVNIVLNADKVDFFYQCLEWIMRLSNTAHCNYQFLQYVLYIYKKDISNVVALVGENARINREFGTVVGERFVGFHIHRFHQAVKDILLQQEDLLSKIRYFMC